MRSARELDMSRAIWKGVVSQDVPSMDLPSGRVIVIDVRGCSVRRQGSSAAHTLPGAKQETGG